MKNSLIFFLSLCLILVSPSSALAASRGYFTSVSEIQHIKSKALAGNQTYQARIDSMIGFAGSPTNWPFGTVSGALTAPSSGTCSSPQDSSGPDFLKYNSGARLVYSKVLAYHFTGNQEYAVNARDKILQLTSTTNFGGDIYNGANQCILELAFSLPIWIQSADLLEGSPVWTAQDKLAFQNWLSQGVYTKVAWASRARANNWGAAGSVAAAMIADYVSDRAITLTEVQPAAKTLTPAQAYQEHIKQETDRATGVFKGDSQCSIWGIQSYGGIPDELRRGAAGCTGLGIPSADNSLVYQITHTDFIIIMAEFLWHRGDTSLYEQVAGDGKGSLKKAIYFVINNSNNGSGVTWEAYRAGHLYLPRRYYKDSVITAAANSTDVDNRGTFIPFGQVTHADEDTVPPVVSPPQTQVLSACQKADFNDDNVVDLVDYSLLVRNFLSLTPNPIKVDINNDGSVDLIEYSLLVQQFLKKC